MKVLFCNQLFSQGHMSFDEKIIACLSTFFEVIVIAPENWYRALPDNVKTIEYNYQEKKCSKIKFANKCIENMRFAGRIAKKYHIRKVIVGTYETITFSLYNFFFPSDCQLFLFQHNNIDLIISSKIKRVIFSLYKNKVISIVLEKFIFDYVKAELGLEQKNVRCIPHPINKFGAEILEKKKYHCVGISGSNDENLISGIVKQEIKSQYIKKAGLKILLKSSEITYDNGYLKVIQGWLSNKEYLDIINNAKCVLVAFPDSFGYRVSATVIDAFTRKIPVIATDIHLIKQYRRDYPTICKIYQWETFLNSIIEYSKPDKKRDKAFENFEKDHSDETVAMLLKKMLLEEKK